MANNNIQPGGWYKGADYYITGKGEKKGIRYIGKLTEILLNKANGTKTLQFNNIRNAEIRNAETDEKIMNNDDVTNGIFNYIFSTNRDNMYDDEYSSNKWTPSLVPGSSAWKTDMGIGGSRRKRRTRKSRKVKRKRTHRRKRY